MTYHGTNTYLIEAPDGLIVLDPGPADEVHLDTIARAASGAVAILLSHGHRDHCEGAPALAARLGVPVLGFRGFRSQVAQVTRGLDDGDRVGGMTCLHTPGHAPDHLCFARPDGITFSADQVMAWSSSIVPHPSGNMVAFLQSLRALRDRGDRLLLPGHGPALPDPVPFIDELIARRLEREREILDALRLQALTVEEIVQALYAKRGPSLAVAAANNVRAHLAKLEAERRVLGVAGDRWQRAAEETATVVDAKG
jgi:glyoxylase-like metal-dependent hydrolase (beta-lactamase superfamily II)